MAQDPLDADDPRDPDEAPAADVPLDPTETFAAVEFARPAPEPATDAEIEALSGAAFETVWRGYDPAAVDRYVAAVERAVARFEERSSPTVAVRAALDRVGEQTSAILRQAEESAEQTTRTSRAQADDRLQRAEREAQELQAAAVARVRSLDDDIERLWQERQRLIDATKELSEQLRGVAADAEARFPPDEAQGPRAPAPPPAEDVDLD
jgi:DivIVA domain-containing protein